MQWTKALKIALLEENNKAIEQLIQQLPQFDSLEQMQEAAYLMQAVHEYLNAQKDDCAATLIKIKKHKAFLANHSQQTSSFDQSH